MMENEALRAIQKLHDDSPSAFEQFIRILLRDRPEYGCIELCFARGKFERFERRSTHK